MSMAAPSELTSHSAQNQTLRDPIELAQYRQSEAPSPSIEARRTDVATLTVGAKLVVQASGLAQGQSNAAQAQRLTQNAGDGLSAITDVLQQMGELAVRGAVGAALSARHRKDLSAQYTALADQVQRIAQATEYNGTKLTDGSAPRVRFQVGANASAANQITAQLPNATPASLGIDHTDLPNAQNAAQALSSLDGAQGQVAHDRENLGATSDSLIGAQRFAQTQQLTLKAAQTRQNQPRPGVQGQSEEARALVRSRSARQAQRLYKALLP